MSHLSGCLAQYHDNQGLCTSILSGMHHHCIAQWVSGKTLVITNVYVFAYVTLSMFGTAASEMEFVYD